MTWNWVHCQRYDPHGHDWKVLAHLVDGCLGWRCDFCREVIVVGNGGWLYWLFTVDEEP